jgi:hypothetical protein
MMLVIPGSAVALTAGQADAQGAAAAAPQSAPTVHLRPRQIGYGQDVTVTGSLSAADAGQRLLLEYAPAGSSSWHTLTSAKVRRNGRYELVAPLPQTGHLRVLAANGGTVARARTGASSDAAIVPSASQRVVVNARFAVPSQSYDVLGGQSIDVRGKLLPGSSGRKVRLEGRSGGGWQWLASARTGPRGGFDLRYVPGSTGQEQLRVRFEGDRLNDRSSTGAGQLTVYRASVASWYNDGGSTACGFHAQYGVANKSLPCGTKVTFHYNGRSVTATVDDRGPYVGGREWDLNQNTAGALGFGGVDTVWSSI